MLFVFYAIRSLLARFRVNAISMLSLALLVVGLSLGLSFYLGIKRSFVDTARPEDLLVVSAGAPTEAESTLSLDAVHKLVLEPGIAVRDGKPLVAQELLGPINLDDAGSSEFHPPAMIRGIDDNSWDIHRARVITGTAPQPGSLEVIVGKGIIKRYPNVNIGSELSLPAGKARVTGIFGCDDCPYENEVWTPRAALDLHTRGAAARAVSLIAQDPAAVIRSIEADKSLNAYAAPLASFRESSLGLATIAWTILALLILLGTVGSLAIGITMHSALLVRIPELAALAAIGIRKGVLARIVLLESVLLALIGALIGALLGQLAVRALGAMSFGSVSITLSTSSIVLVVELVLGLAVGLLGGAVPAMTVRRIDIKHALR